MARLWEDLTDEELFDVYESSYTSVRILKCFSTKDAILLDRSERELTNRGYVNRIR